MPSTEPIFPWKKEAGGSTAHAFEIVFKPKDIWQSICGKVRLHGLGKPLKAKPAEDVCPLCQNEIDRRVMYARKD